MAKIKILDTGYINNSLLSSQTQLSASNRAGYTGSTVSSFTLDSISVMMSGSVNIERKPVINKLTDPTSSLISANGRVYSVNFVLKKEIITTGWQYNNLYQLSQLERTYGLKLLYPSSTGDVLPSIIEPMGEVNKGSTFSSASSSDSSGTVSTTTPYLVGRVKNFRLNDEPSGNYWRVSFDFLVEGE